MARSLAGNFITRGRFRSYSFGCVTTLFVTFDLVKLTWLNPRRTSKQEWQLSSAAAPPPYSVSSIDHVAVRIVPYRTIAIASGIIEYHGRSGAKDCH